MFRTARLLSEFIGTVDGHLEHNPFLEIVSVPLSISRNLSKTNDAYRNGSEEFGDLKENVSRRSANFFLFIIYMRKDISKLAIMLGAFAQSLRPRSVAFLSTAFVWAH